MNRIINDPKRNAKILRALREKEENLVHEGEKLAQSLVKGGKLDKERQLRNIQEIAEQSTSWAEVELFIRYQAARREIPVDWAKETITKLEELRGMARSIVGVEDNSLIRKVHLELVRRILGYTVRWHVWHTKGETQVVKGGGR